MDSTPRQLDKASREWRDGEVLFLHCAIWRAAAENVTESLRKGDRVITSGRLKQRRFDKDGEQRTVTKLDVDEIGPSLRYVSAKAVRANRSDTVTKDAVLAGKGRFTEDEPPF